MPLRKRPRRGLVVVDADVGEAAALLGRWDVEEPVQPIQLLLREVLEKDGLLGLEGIARLGFRTQQSTLRVPACRFLAVPEAKDLARSLQGYPPLSDQEQQNALQGLALRIAAESLHDLVGQCQLYVHIIILTRRGHLDRPLQGGAHDRRARNFFLGRSLSPSPRASPSKGG